MLSPNCSVLLYGIEFRQLIRATQGLFGRPVGVVLVYVPKYHEFPDNPMALDFRYN